MGEYLSSFYESESVDLVVIQNALDHSANPLKVIKEALSVLRIGGVLYLNHHLNEAEAENYKGFHKFNICDEKGRLTLWNKDVSLDVADHVSSFAEVESLLRLENGHVVAVVRKTGGLPADALSLQKDRGELCMLTMSLQKKSVLSFCGIRYCLIYSKYNFIQFFAQLLSWKWKMRLKRILTRH